MRVSLVGHGTRGDLAPLVAVASQLRSRGHDVRLAMPGDQAWLALSHGMDVVPLVMNTAEVLASPRGRRALATGNFLRLARWLTELQHRHAGELDGAVRLACADADAVVTTYALQERAAAMAELRDVPLVTLHLPPLVPHPRLANPLIRTSSSRSATLNLATHGLFRTVAWRSLGADTEVFRRSLGLAPAGGPVPARTLPAGHREPVAVSGLLVPEIASTAVGFIRPAAIDGEDGALTAWLASGPPPVHVDFGSMPLPDPHETLATVAAVCRGLGRRALVVSRETDPGFVDDVAVVRGVDHAAVLPQVAAVVCHAGVGTLAAALRAGVPVVACPFYADQPFWADRVVRTGAGVALPFRRLMPDRLAAALREALSEPVRTRAAIVGRALAAEPDAAPLVADQVLRRCG